ncbi:alpha/beta fold hydrolase [Candidatus Micrarchaeota archaeon]|nr:alpha/beta fold hydrolase [Candidatus Micrarchaeota archaeon]
MNPLFVVLAVLFLLGCLTPDSYSVSESGQLHYPTQRQSLVYSEVMLANTLDRVEHKVTLQLNDGNVSALVWTPNSDGRYPAILFVPGAGVGKEAGKAYADLLVPHDFIVMAMDSRGVGETSALGRSLSEDYALFIEGKEPSVHRNVYDILRAYDYLRQRSDVDDRRIIFAGESMGARSIIIAAVNAPDVRAVVGISTSGYGLEKRPSVQETRFVHSIDPENYVSMLAPRPFVQIHSPNDPGIPISIAKNVYWRAQSPKEFKEAPCPNHGYCTEMNPVLEQTFVSLVE